MRPRAIEWRPGTGFGWARLADEQIEAANFNVIDGVADEPGVLSTRFRDYLRAGARFVDPPVDTVLLVFGQVGPGDEKEMRAWLDGLFPEIVDHEPHRAGLHPLERIARLLCDFHDDELVLASTSSRALNLTRMRMRLPRLADDVVTLLPVTVLVLGGALIVCWHDKGLRALDETSRVDGEARGHQYSGGGVEPVNQIASRYVAACLAAYPRVATNCSRWIDAWEASFVGAVAARARSATGADTFQDLGRMRRNVVQLQEGLDEIEQGRVYPLAELWWSIGAEGGSVRTSEVAQALDRATNSVDRLRTDVSDSFVMASVAGTMEQLRIAHENQARFERLQEAVTRLTTFLLAPGLVAAVFGANVALPGHTGGVRLAVMLVAMIGSAFVSHGLLSRLSDRDQGAGRGAR